MKLTCLFLLNLALLPVADAGTSSVDIEAFKNVANPFERRNIIRQAPVEQQRELAQIDQHLSLLKRCNGELGIKALRETLATHKRGLGALMDLVPVELQVWDLDIGGKIGADAEAGVSPAQTQESLAVMRARRALLENRQSAVHDLVFNLAPSPQALKVNVRVEAILLRLCEWLSNTVAHFPLTTAQRTALDGEMEAVLSEMGSLSTLTPAQAQKEYDASDENQIDLGTLLD